MFINHVCQVLGMSLFLLVGARGLALETTFLRDKKVYYLPRMPIDVVIPCVEKDQETLELCIAGIKQNIENVRRIIVVSANSLTKNAEWFDEKKYPFTPFDLSREIFQNEDQAARFLASPSRMGWIYQQLLKLYAPFVISDISSNVLIVDADTIFLNPVQFLGPMGEGKYNPGTENHHPYFAHASKLIPGLTRVYPAYSGISHHMLFQKDVIEDLFRIIEGYHGIETWKALCRCIDPARVNESCMSEYEIYFNFVFARSDQMQIRPLAWANISNLDDISLYQMANYHYVSCHSYLRHPLNN